MANYEIGAKIGISGWQEFRKQISQINKNYKSLTDYSAALAKQMAREGATADTLKQKHQVLERQMSLLSRKQEEISDALSKAREKYSENSTAIMRLEGALLDVRNSMADVERELQDTEQAMDDLANGIEDVADASEDAGDGVLTFGDALKAGIASGAILDAAEEIGEAVLEIGREAVEAAAEVKAANSQFEQTFRELEGTARSALEHVADDTGIAVTRMQDAYTGLYAFTKSIGADSQTALGIAQRAMVAAADSAAYYDRSMEDATETLQSFLKGNYENDAALGIAATETTRNAKANELYAKSFQELSEAQKVDVLLAMVEAGNAASGALGQAAREADSWTNVLGEASEAWRQLLAVVGTPVMEGLIPLIQGVTSAMQGLIATTEADELRSAMADYEAALASANEALEETRRETQTNAAMASQYVSRLKALEQAGLHTAEAQEEYTATVELLNELLPGLNLAIDEQTGKLNMSTDAILLNAEALKKQSMYQQLQENYTSLIDAQAAAEIELSASKKRLIELEAQEAALKEQGADASRVYASTTQMVAGEVVALSGVYSEYDAQLAAVEAEQAHLEAQIAESEAAFDALGQEVEDAGNALSDAAPETDKMSAALADLNGRIEAAKTAQEKMATAYELAKLEAQDSIRSQIGLFTELETESEMSASEIVKNWQKQQEAILKYEDNLRRGIEMGLAPELMAQLADGSQESMLMLDELVNSTDMTVDEINAAFGGRLKADEYASEAMRDVRLAVDAEYQQMVADTEAAGYDVMYGAARGVRNYAYLLEQAMGEAADLGNKAYRMGWELNSPSRVMEDNSYWIMEGGIREIERRTRDMERAIANMADASVATLQEKLEAAEAFPASMPAAVSTSTSNTYHRGATYITINAQDGQSAREIARQVADILCVDAEREGAAFG